MIAARRRSIILVTAIIAVAAAALAYSQSRPARNDAKPILLLLTSLPIAFGESMSLNAPKSPVLDALEEQYRVIPVATSSAKELRQGPTLLMIQPYAQSPDDLVALDNWVREGGRLLLLADPLLQRADSRALDDLTRPPPMFLDTGLLAHWGLRLDSPDAAGPAWIEVGGSKVDTLSPGTMRGACAISDDRSSARCAIGKGRAVIIADADFLDGGESEDQPGALRQLIAELESISS